MVDLYASLTTCNRVSLGGTSELTADIRSDAMFAQELVLVQHLLEDLDQPILVCQSKEPPLSLTRD